MKKAAGDPLLLRRHWSGFDVIGDGAGLLFGFEPGDESRTVPKLNILPVQEAARLCDGVVIIVANQRLKSGETPVIAHDVCPILSH
jgi:hypothetical protein